MHRFLDVLGFELERLRGRTAPSSGAPATLSSVAPTFVGAMVTNNSKAKINFAPIAYTDCWLRCKQKILLLTPLPSATEARNAS